MGCFNVACSITGLPIKCGDEVIAIPMIDYDIMDGEHERTHGMNQWLCYTTDICRPMYGYIKGEYNEYGGLSNVKSSKDVVDFITKPMTKDRDHSDSEIFDNGYMRGAIFSKANSWNEETRKIKSIEVKKPLFWAFVKQDVVDSIMSDCNLLNQYNDTSNINAEQLSEAFINAINDPTNNKLMSERFWVTSLIRTVFTEFVGDTLYIDDTWNIFDTLREAIENDDRILLLELCEMMIVVKRLNFVKMMLNQVWLPWMSAGQCWGESEKYAFRWQADIINKLCNIVDDE